jgi:hypothetical protein
MWLGSSTRNVFFRISAKLRCIPEDANFYINSIWWRVKVMKFLPLFAFFSSLKKPFLFFLVDFSYLILWNRGFFIGIHIQAMRRQMQYCSLYTALIQVMLWKVCSMWTSVYVSKSLFPFLPVARLVSPRFMNWCTVCPQSHSGVWKIVARKQTELATCGLRPITAKLWNFVFDADRWNKRSSLRF